MILDSNFLFVPSEFHVDVLEELETRLDQNVDPILLSTTHEEIKKIAEKGKPKMRQHASLALELAKKCRVVEVEKAMKESYDDVVVRVAEQWGSPVATNDRVLRRRLRSKGIPVIFLRQRKRLELEGTL